MKLQGQCSHCSESNFTHEKARKFLKYWSEYDTSEQQNCKELGEEKCRVIKVEDIYLNWKKSVNEILDWLGERTLKFDSEGFLQNLKKNYQLTFDCKFYRNI